MRNFDTHPFNPLTDPFIFPLNSDANNSWDLLCNFNKFNLTDHYVELALAVGSKYFTTAYEETMKGSLESKEVSYYLSSLNVSGIKESAQYKACVTSKLGVMYTLKFAGRAVNETNSVRNELLNRARNSRSASSFWAHWGRLIGGYSNTPEFDVLPKGVHQDVLSSELFRTEDWEKLTAKRNADGLDFIRNIRDWYVDEYQLYMNFINETPSYVHSSAKALKLNLFKDVGVVTVPPYKKYFAVEGALDHELELTT